MHTIKDTVKQLVGKSLDAYNTNYTKPINDRINKTQYLIDQLKFNIAEQDIQEIISMIK